MNGEKAEIILAENCGFCFGVRRAVDTVYKLRKKTDKKIIVAGELIHNKMFIEQLEKDGIFCVDENDIDKLALEKDNVIIVIRTHGATKQLVEKIERIGFSYIDATCPFVKRIHKIVDQNSVDCDYTVISGDKNHPEVKGIQSYSHSATVVCSDEKECYDFVNEVLKCSQKKLLMVSQTTNNHEKYVNCQKIIKKLYTNAKIFDTICNVTEKRQNGVKRMSMTADVMCIIGCVKSSNTKKLYGISSQNCKNTYLIESASDVPEKELKNILGKHKIIPEAERRGFIVGITAGASTPDDIIEEVKVRINEIVFSDKKQNDGHVKDK